MEHLHALSIEVYLKVAHLYGGSKRGQLSVLGQHRVD